MDEQIQIKKILRRIFSHYLWKEFTKFIIHKLWKLKLMSYLKGNLKKRPWSGKWENSNRLNKLVYNSFKYI